MSDSWILSRGNNHWRSADNLFDEMAVSSFDEWRSPNRILEVTIHRVCYPITESVLHQVFRSFGGVVDQILVIGGTDVVMACVVFDSVEVAADAYGELHGRYIYDGCCQMEIKWGLYQVCEATPDTGYDAMVAEQQEWGDQRLPASPSAVALAAPTAPVPPASALVVPVPSSSAMPASSTTAPAPEPPITAPAPEPPICITPSAIGFELASTDISRSDVDTWADVPALDVAAAVVSPIRTQEHDGDLRDMEVDKVVEGGFAALQPRRAPPWLPRPRRPGAHLCVPWLRRLQRAPPRPPRPRRPCRARLRAPRLRRPRRAPVRLPQPRRQQRASPRLIRCPRRRPPRPPWRIPPRAHRSRRPRQAPSAVARAPVVPPSTEEATFINCLMICLNCDDCSLEDAERRYIIPVTSAFSVGDVLFGAAIHSSGNCNLLGKVADQNSVMLEPMHAILIDKGPRPFNLNFEHVNIPPKPPWSILCLEDGFNNNIAIHLWLELFAHAVKRRIITANSSSLSSDVVLLGVVTVGLWYQMVFEIVGALNPVLPQLLDVELVDKGPRLILWQYCHSLITDTSPPLLRSEQSFLYGWINEQLQQQWPPPLQFEVLRVSVPLRPMPWPSFCWQPVWQLMHPWFALCNSSVSICRLGILHFEDSGRYWVEFIAAAVQVVGTQWRDIFKMSTSSVWEVQLFHPITPAVHILALARAWGMLFLFMVNFFDLLKIFSHGHGTCDGGTSSLLRCSGHECGLYSPVNISEFLEVLNMDECCKNYRLNSLIYLSRGQQQQQFSDVPLATIAEFLLPPWPPPTTLLFQGVGVLLACSYSENLLLYYNAYDIGAPQQIELQSWTDQDGLQGIQIAGIRHIWVTVGFSSGARLSFHPFNIQVYKLLATKSSALFMMVLWLLQYYAQVLEDP